MRHVETHSLGTLTCLSNRMHSCTTLLVYQCHVSYLERSRLKHVIVIVWSISHLTTNSPIDRFELWLACINLMIMTETTMIIMLESALERSRSKVSYMYNLVSRWSKHLLAMNIEMSRTVVVVHLGTSLSHRATSFRSVSHSQSLSSKSNGLCLLW